MEKTYAVTEYLNRARDCAAIADRTRNETDKKKLLEIAEAWADLAKAAAAEATSHQPPHSKNDGGDAR
jgi:hypothetical protein